MNLLKAKIVESEHIELAYEETYTYKLTRNHTTNRFETIKRQNST